MIEQFIMEDQPTLIELGIILAFKTGLRVGEISTLSWSDIAENKIHISKTEIRYRDDSGKNMCLMFRIFQRAMPDLEML